MVVKNDVKLRGVILGSGLIDVYCFENVVKKLFRDRWGLVKRLSSWSRNLRRVNVGGVYNINIRLAIGNASA